MLRQAEIDSAEDEAFVPPLLVPLDSTHQQSRMRPHPIEIGVEGGELTVGGERVLSEAAD